MGVVLFPPLAVFSYLVCVYCLCKQILLNIFDPFPVSFGPLHPLSVDCFSVENGKHESIMPNLAFCITLDGTE